MRRTLVRTWRAILIWLFVCYELGSLLDFIFFSAVNFLWYISVWFLDCLFGTLWDFFSYWMNSIVTETIEIVKLNLMFIADRFLEVLKTLNDILPQKITLILKTILQELTFFLKNLISCAYVIVEDLNKYFK